MNIYKITSQTKYNMAFNYGFLELLNKIQY